MSARISLYILLIMTIFYRYAGCPSQGFPTDKRLRLHQQTCLYAKDGFATALANAFKRKLAAEAQEAASKLRENEEREAEHQRLCDIEAESSFHPDEVCSFPA